MHLLLQGCTCHTKSSKNGSKVSTEGTTQGPCLLEQVDIGTQSCSLFPRVKMTSLLNEGRASNRANSFTAHQKYIQQILAVTFASISILSALVTIYWFVRLKKIYRYQLIMMLIVSGMFKAMWYFIPPILVLVRKRPVSRAACHGFGFLLALGIEASGLSSLPFERESAERIIDQTSSSSLSLCTLLFQYYGPGNLLVCKGTVARLISAGPYLPSFCRGWHLSIRSKKMHTYLKGPTATFPYDPFGIGLHSLGSHDT